MMKSCGPVGVISHTSVRVISFIARASRSGHRVATLVRFVCEFPFSVEGAPTNGTAPAMESNYVRRVRRHLRRSCRRPDDLGFRRRRPVAGPSRCSPGNNDGNHAGRRGGVVCAAPILRTAASPPDLASGARHRNHLQPRGARGARNELLPPEHATADPAVVHSAPQLAPVTSSPLAGASKKRLRTADLSTDLSSPSDVDSHTAIYDIPAHTVYLPNGRRLEAHSGLAGYMDDARYVNVKDRGATPPNIYDLALREQVFHGVRAIRLVPVDGGKMFGRDGMLAHSYITCSVPTASRIVVCPSVIIPPS